MIIAYVVNNTGKYKHIFKKNVSPGMEVPLEELYAVYKSSYAGDFDLNFVEWLNENKVPEGFDIVVEKYEEPKKVEVIEDNVCSTDSSTNVKLNKPLEKITSKQIADLKIKDDPKTIVSTVDSIHKLRRALTLCNGMKGKSTLIKYIKNRIEELS